MKLLSVNVATPREIIHNGKSVMTGIYKEPVAGRVMIRSLNLDGDRQADLRAHGGKYKAIYAYPFEHYAVWQQELGRDDFNYGQFGENLTVEGMCEDQIHIGDVFRVGSAFLEVTQPRVPCFKLGHKMGTQVFVKQFHHSKRTGFYLRVLEEGEVGAGDDIERIKIDPERMSVQEVFHTYYFEPENLALVERAARLSALAPGWRKEFKKLLGK